MGYEANRRVEASARTFAIVERLSEADRAGVSALAEDLGMSKGIVHNHLSTLRELGYVRKVDDDYQLAPRLLRVGLRARSNAALYRFAADLCEAFATQLDTGVVLCQHADGDCTVLDAYTLPSGSDLGAGTTFPLGGSLVGLVSALAGDDAPADVDAAYDIATVRASLDAEGYAVGPLSPDHGDCVAVPIVDDGEVHGSVGVLLPADEGARERVTEATASLRDRVEARFDSGWTGERSFATEKHSWVG
jgi:DNA-binding IclR family transcriptional regulator